MATNQNLKKQYEETKPNHEVLSASSSNSKNEAVSTIIDAYTKKVDGNVSVYYKNLTTGEEVSVDGKRNYYMASLYKVIITLYILEREKNGEISLSQTVGNPPLTLEKALEKIITESNNEYALAIAQKYGWENIENYIKKRFLLDFTFRGDLLTNVETMGSLFEHISEAIKLTDTESEYLLRLLHEQTRTSKLPKYLPHNIYSHNKTGEFEQFSHDAGLFYTPKANYILIFMSKTPKPEATNEQMAQMSEEIFKTLNE